MIPCYSGGALWEYIAKKGQKKGFFGVTLFWPDFSDFRGLNTLGSFRVFSEGKHPGKARVKFCVKITPKNTFLRRAAHPPRPPARPRNPRNPRIPQNREKPPNFIKFMWPTVTPFNVL